MHMRHALPRLDAILHRDVEAALRDVRWRREVGQREHVLHALDGEEEVARLARREVGESRNDAVRAHQDVAGEEGLEVHEGERERC